MECDYPQMGLIYEKLFARYVGEGLQTLPYKKNLCVLCVFVIIKIQKAFIERLKNGFSK